MNKVYGGPVINKNLNNNLQNTFSKSQADQQTES